MCCAAGWAWLVVYEDQAVVMVGGVRDRIVSRSPTYHCYGPDIQQCTHGVVTQALTTDPTLVIRPPPNLLLDTPLSLPAQTEIPAVLRRPDHRSPWRPRNHAGEYNAGVRGLEASASLCCALWHIRLFFFWGGGHAILRKRNYFINYIQELVNY